jgi:hypothetical protein
MPDAHGEPGSLVVLGVPPAGPALNVVQKVLTAPSGQMSRTLSWSLPVGLECPCPGRRGDRLGALGAVVQEPGDLIGHLTGAAADPLADADRRHRPRPPTISAATTPSDPARELPMVGQT